jgi:hypothetical protein
LHSAGHFDETIMAWDGALLLGKQLSAAPGVDRFLSNYYLSTIGLARDPRLYQIDDEFKFRERKGSISRERSNVAIAEDCLALQQVLVSAAKPNAPRQGALHSEDLARLCEHTFESVSRVTRNGEQTSRCPDQSSASLPLARTRPSGFGVHDRAPPGFRNQLYEWQVHERIKGGGLFHVVPSRSDVAHHCPQT